MKSKFIATQPWTYNANEKPLKEIIPITQDQLEKEGYQQNVHYSSVVRIDPRKDTRNRMPDHLNLPKYCDKFIAEQDPKLVRDLASGPKGISINELKWQVGLRNHLKTRLDSAQRMVSRQNRDLNNTQEDERRNFKSTTVRFPAGNGANQPPRSQTASKKINRVQRR